MDQGTNDLPRQWQFSLRALLVAMLVVAMVLVAARWLGHDIALWGLFVGLVGGPQWKFTQPARRSHLAALVAVYGPFVVMAAFMLLFVDCSHCKQAATTMLPYGPGMATLELAHHLVNLPRVPSDAAYLVAFLVAMCFVWGLTWLFYRRGWWVRTLVMAVALTYFSFCAVGLFAAIRS